MSNSNPYPIYGILAAVLALAVALGVYGARHGQGSAALVEAASNSENPNMVTVRVIGPDGELTGPVQMPPLVLSEEAWKQRLTPEQYAVVRSKGTERPFCGTLLDNKKDGIYACVACGLPLFSSDSKFHSGTGWPSFFQPVTAENIHEERDASLGMVRTEIMCARCRGHLGHVFDDGPKPTGLRYCLNSESLRFVDKTDVKTLAEKLPEPKKEEKSAAMELSELIPKPAQDIPRATEPGETTAVFANGCFWCTEAVFEQVPGVKAAVSGYSGGDANRADYKAVSSGSTGHAEAIELTYDPSKVSYGDLLRVFFASHDPTTKDRQGPDRGHQYRSAIFYKDDSEKKVAEAYIKQLDAAHAFDKPIVTTLEPFDKFYPAEDYHQDFMKNNPRHPYIQMWAVPKVQKIQKYLDTSGS